MDADGKWIWIPEWKITDEEEAALVLFRKEVELSAEVKKSVLQISADSRYKLFVNGQLAEVGPSKGDRQVWFFDEVDISSYLQFGKNVIAVQVLRYPTKHGKGNYGIFRTENPGLYVKGGVLDTEGGYHCLNGNAGWKCRKDEKFHIKSESEIFAPLQIYEMTAGDETLKGWMYCEYDESGWSTPFVYEHMDTSVSPGNLLPRTIPYLYRKNGRFEKVMAVSSSVFSKEVWESFLRGEIVLKIPPNTEEIVEISAGVEKTAYLHLGMQGGKGSDIEILQSEAYVQNKMRGEFPMKGHREDYENGHLEGFADYYHVGGFGIEEQLEEYEPFWFRTFRFVRLKIRTSEQPLMLDRLDYTETGYPLAVKTEVETSDPRLKEIWNMSERTLKLCMHETYEDCPFYEQLQYAMDSRSQILYTYSVSADDRLAKKCMDDFKRSQRYDGLLNCSYPCYGPNVIPGFSIYYILMLYDHMMYFGERDFLKEHMPVIEGILNYFHGHRNRKGYVDKIGGLNGKDRFWSFIDWTPEWDETTGVPTATLYGAITMESLLYIMGLQHAAEIAEYLHRNEQAKEYRSRAEEMKGAVRRYCTGENQMIQDGPGIEQYSQQTQVFAILTETIDPKRGRKVLEETIRKKENYVQCSVAMAFYLFRALQKTGLYAYTEEYWNIWTRMLEKGAVTCVENEVGERSECHAWGALILYELPSTVLGVQPAEPGYRSVKIQPEPGYLTGAQGEVVTPNGMIRVKWSKETELKLEYEVPENMEVLV